MPYLTCEVMRSGRDYWEPLHAVHPADPPYCLTDAGRGDIILFSCMGPTSLIVRAIGAARSIQPLSPLMRAVLVAPELTETLAQISRGQSYEQDVQSTKGLIYRAKWIHHG
jgi:hypothetical protein